MRILELICKLNDIEEKYGNLKVKCYNIEYRFDIDKIIIEKDEIILMEL